MKFNKTYYKLWLHLILLLSLFADPVCVEGADIPNFDHAVTLIAREQPLDSFLKELFGQISLPVMVDEAVTGYVNGMFERMSAERVFSDIAKSFGLVMYYDGAVVYVYTSNNITRRIMPASKVISKRIVNAASELDLTDSRNTIRRAVGGGLVITGTRRFIEQIDELLYAAEHNLKNYEPPVGFKVFYLKYAWAQDVSMTFAGRQVVIPGVATILRELIEDIPRGYTLDHSRDKLISPTLPGLRGKGLNSIGDSDRIGLPDNPQLYKLNRPQVLNTDANAINNIVANQSSSVRIQADPRLNAIIVRDSPDRMPRYKHLIDALDIEPQMLEIEATIIDINTNKMRQLGINWRWQNDEDEVLFGSGGSSDLRLTPNRRITPTGKGGFVSFVLGDNAKFISRINALEEKGAAHVVSRPNVITLSNVEAIFDSSSTFYVRVAGREEVDLFNISVGTSMRVTPHVFKDDGIARIKLLITIEDGRTSEKDEIDNIPIIERSSINTQALINAGESVLIGGLVREISDENEDKVPFLSDIPVMGNLFRSTGKKTLRFERLFLISPKLSIHRLAKTVDTSNLNAEQLKQKIKGNDKEDVTKNNYSITETIDEKTKKYGEASWDMLLNH